jgi:hypothetical protein
MPSERIEHHARRWYGEIPEGVSLETLKHILAAGLNRYRNEKHPTRPAKKILEDWFYEDACETNEFEWLLHKYFREDDEETSYLEIREIRDYFQEIIDVAREMRTAAQ